MMPSRNSCSTAVSQPRGKASHGSAFTDTPSSSGTRTGRTTASWSGLCPEGRCSGRERGGGIARSASGLVGSLARAGYLVVLDEFPYFNRQHLRPFCSFLQAEVDSLASDAGRVPVGLLVLGSIHTEMQAILEDRSAPLYNRTTDEMTLTHLDIASLKALLREQAGLAPERLLFLWTLLRASPSSTATATTKGD
jgi:hypothetical protein